VWKAKLEEMGWEEVAELQHTSYVVKAT